MDLPSSGSDYDEGEEYGSESGGDELTASLEQTSIQSPPAATSGGPMIVAVPDPLQDPTEESVRETEAAPLADQMPTTCTGGGEVGRARAIASEEPVAALVLDSIHNEGKAVCSPVERDVRLQPEDALEVGSSDTAPVAAWLENMKMQEQVS